MPSVLGLDLASHTGWCIVTGMSCVPRFGSWDAPRNQPDGVYSKRYAELMFWLEDMHLKHQFDGIAFECPLQVPGDKQNTVRLLTGFAVIVETFAGLMTERIGRKFPCMEVSVQMVKKAVSGDAFASKEQQRANAARRGWKVADHDEADAGGVAFTAFANFWPELAAVA